MNHEQANRLCIATEALVAEQKQTNAYLAEARDLYAAICAVKLRSVGEDPVGWVFARENPHEITLQHMRENPGEERRARLFARGLAKLEEVLGLGGPDVQDGPTKTPYRG